MWSIFTRTRKVGAAHLDGAIAVVGDTQFHSFTALVYHDGLFLHDDRAGGLASGVLRGVYHRERVLGRDRQEGTIQSFR